MNIVLAYNESDWSSGWTTFLDGFTMYYADRREQDLDFKASFSHWNDAFIIFVSRSRCKSRQEVSRLLNFKRQSPKNWANHIQVEV